MKDNRREKGMQGLLGRCWKMVALVLLLAATSYAADVNILILGSEKDTRDILTVCRDELDPVLKENFENNAYYSSLLNVEENNFIPYTYNTYFERWLGHNATNLSDKAFSPSGIQAELQKILDGAGLGSVNVAYEDRYVTKFAFSAYPEAVNLAGWFHWPFPAGVETSRWANLRGEAGTQWDYVILIGDGYTIEEVPGYYTAGVADVAGEVAKGTGEPILLMPWPAVTSSSTVDHYKEVIYRTGRSGGYKVAPAGLAWQAAGSPTTAGQHPDNDGAYIAAATLFSRIWDRNPAESSYCPDTDLANIVHTTVTNNVGAPQYTGKFDRAGAFAFKSRFGRTPQYILNSSGSTAGKFALGMGLSWGLAGGGLPGDISAGSLRSEWWHGADLDAENSFYAYFIAYDGPDGTEYGYPKIYSSRELLGIAELQYRAELGVPYYDSARCVANTLSYSRLYQRYPESTVVNYSMHVAQEVCNFQGSGVITFETGGGLTPMIPPEDVATWTDYSYQVGYETAWQLATCQVRAPGFRFIPTRLTVGVQDPEIVNVRFFFPPKSNVTVTVTSTDSSITVSPSTLTFTPENYNVIQQVAVQAPPDAARGTHFDLEATTHSSDEVYDDIFCKWEYQVNELPAVQPISVEAYMDQILPITLDGSDPENEPVTYQIITPPLYGTAVIDGPQVIYTPNPGFTGIETFTYNCTDGGDDSAPATIAVTVLPESSYNFNLIQDPSAELYPFSDHGWVSANEPWLQATNATDGTYAFTPGQSPAELYQDVDVSRFGAHIAMGLQPFTISGDLQNGNDVLDIIAECRDSAGTVLSSTNLTSDAGYAWVTREATFIAPVGTTTVRVSLTGQNVGGGSSGILFDRLSLIALEPANSAPVAHAQSGVTASAGIANPIVLGASDIDLDDTLTYTIVTPPSHGTISGTGADRTYTPTAGYTGADTLTFKVNDGALDSNLATISFDVVLNQAPTIVLDSPTTNSTAIPLNVDMLLRTRVWDDGLPNPLQLSWSVVGDPQGSGFFTNPTEPITGARFYSDGQLTGNYVLRLTATDGEITTTQDVAVEVGVYDYSKNLGPYIFHFESYEGTPGVAFELTNANAADDGNPNPPAAFTYEWQKVSGPGNFTVADGTVAEPMVTFDRVGSYVIRLIANDSEVEDYNDFPVTITASGNLAPVAVPALLSPANPMKDDTVTLTGADSYDPNLDSITYAWVQTSGTTVSLSATDTAEPTFVALETGIYTFELTVTDGTLSNTASVDVLVANTPPAVDAGASQTIVLDGLEPIPWVPEASSTAAWYDPADPAARIASGGAVSQLNDKSGNGNHAAQATGSVQPLLTTVNGLSALDFGSARYLTLDSMPTYLQDTAYTVFFVGGSSSYSDSHWMGSTWSSGYDKFQFGYKNASTIELKHNESGAANWTKTLDSNNHVFTHAFKNPGSQLWYDGADEGSNSNPSAALGALDAASSCKIGTSQWTGGNAWNGTICEILILTSYDQATREKVEGYLAHKWGMASNLASGHPYKADYPADGNLPIATLALGGTVDDPDLENTVTSIWSVVSTEPAGLEAVAFDDTSVPNTTATFYEAGTYVLRLTADDGAALPVSSEVTITVTDLGGNLVPTADAGSPQSVTDTDDNGSESVTLDGSGSFDSDGTIASYAWTEGGSQIATGISPTVALGVGSHTITLTVTDNDGATDTAQVLVTVNAAANNAPTADAGTDQTVSDTDENGSESVTLDGSGSSDSDGTIAGYVWTEGGTQIATGVSPTVALGVGSHTITLTVTDNDGATDTAQVVVTVNAAANNAPTADAGTDQTVTDTDDNGSESVTLDGSGSSDSDGTIAGYVWTEGGTQIATGVSPTIALGIGSHTITLTVTDNDGATDTAQVVVTVNAAANTPPVVSIIAPAEVVLGSGGDGTAWTPADIATAAWYDPADPAAITESGGAVSQLNDKSSNANNATQTLGAAQPLLITVNGLTALDVSDARHFILDALPTYLQDTAYTVFFVGGSSRYSDSHWMGSTWSSGYDKFQFGYKNASTIELKHNVGGAANWTKTLDSNNHLFTHAFKNSGSQLWYDGADQGSNSNPSAALGSFDETSICKIGTSQWTGGNAWDGTICEIVILTSYDQATREKMEGYLAHKWGLTANLPADHPFKTAAPTSGGIPTATATLAGTASDADAGDTVTVTWSVVSTDPAGLAAPTFADASALDTTVTFTEAGQYTIKLTGTDTLGATGESNVVITVNNASSTLDHFELSVITGPQIEGVPFPVTITARKADGSTDTSYNGTATLEGERADSSPVPVTPSTVSFTNGIGTVNVTVQEPATQMTLKVSN